MNYRNILLLLICFLYSCSHYSEDIETVLKQAGSNRSKLEKVLKHYNRNPSDSLKLRAAEYLIVNMPGKYSEYYDAPWNNVATAMLRWTSSSNKRLISDTYQLGNPVIKEDVKYITAQYLINNIDLAFKVWQERPWGKHISFDIFCEEILPYRIGTEPLENWREKVLASFADLDTVLNKSTTTAVEACKFVNGLLPQFRVDKDFPDMSYSQSMASTRGDCDKIAAFTTFVMRGLGIPTSIDFTPFYTGRNTGHSWNAVCDSTGAHISFMGTETPPGATHQALEFIQNKIFRKTYALQKNIQMPIEKIPPILQDSCFKDASSDYEGFFDIQVPLTVLPPDSSMYVYLAVLGSQSAHNIIAWGHIEGENAVFTAVGRNTGYFPVYYKDNNLIAAGNPFLLDSLGNVLPVVDGPFKGPHILSSRKPCIIPMRDFDIGGEGVAFHEETDIDYGGNGMYRISGGDPFSVSVDIEEAIGSVGRIAAGEWMRYTVEIKDAGTYLCQVSASGCSEGEFHIDVDNKNQTGNVIIPANGEWYKWEWFPKLPLKLTFTTGVHQIRFYCEKPGFNVKDLKLMLLKKLAVISLVDLQKQEENRLNTLRFFLYFFE